MQEKYFTCLICKKKHRTEKCKLKCQSKHSKYKICSASGKRRFYTLDAAHKAICEEIKEADTNILRAYRCRHCGDYHMTKKPYIKPWQRKKSLDQTQKQTKLQTL